MIPIANPEITEADRQAVGRVLDSGMLASGPEVEKFEEEFADFIGSDFAVATTSGTTALDTAVKACGLEPGDKVITTPFTFIASCNSLLFNQVQPVFVDIEPDTFNIDPEKVRQALKEEAGIKGILPVHLFGQPAAMQELQKLAQEQDLVIIEDAAQAHGAAQQGQRVGSFAQAGIFSFYPTKNMTTGEGGMLVTSEPEVAEKARKIINHGRAGRYRHDMLGHNYRSTDIAAALGREQLKRLPDYNKKRRENARYLKDRLAELEWLTLPVEKRENYHVYHQFTVRVNSSAINNPNTQNNPSSNPETIQAAAELRDDFVEHLQAAGVGAGIYYPMPAHQQPLYQERGFQDCHCPEAEKAAREVVSLPVHPALTTDDLDKIVAAVKSFN